MTLDQLRYFCAVCQYNSVTQAAAELNISQPSVSSAIKSLENEFRVSLFHRHQKRLQLTPAGQQLLSLSLSLLKDADALALTIQKFSITNAVIRFGVPPMIGSLYLPGLYNALPALSPQVQVQVVEDDGNGLRKLLSEGKIDMALLPHTHTFEPSLNTLRITQLENVCCVNKAHPLSALSSISLSALGDQPLVLFKNSFFQTERILNTFRAMNITPNILLHTGQLSTLQNMIVSGTAVGFLFSFLADRDSGLVGIPLDPPMTTTVSLVWSKDLPLTDAERSLIAYFKSIAN